MDLGSVRAAPTPALISGTIAAARNAEGLPNDAQALAEAGGAARACSLASLAVEEAGKAVSLVLLTAMPETLRARASAGRMLEWHQLKQVQGLLIARVPYRLAGLACRLAVMPAEELAHVLNALDASADEADRLKRRGLYVDVSRGGRIYEPSEISENEVLNELAWAAKAVSAAGQLLEPETPIRLANPAAELVELSQAGINAFDEAEYARTPDAAVTFVRNAVTKLRDRRAAKDAEGTPVPGEGSVRVEANHCGGSSRR